MKRTEIPHILLFIIGLAGVWITIHNLWGVIWACVAAMRITYYKD